LKGRDHFEKLGIDWRKNIKMEFRAWFKKMWIVFFRLRIGTGGGLL
jgi:hypothetical protein